MSRIILPVHPYLRHPLTGGLLQAVGLKKNGSPIWPVMGASEEGTEGTAGFAGEEGEGQADKGKAEGSKGFPADTPLVEMTDAQQAAYWKHHARQHENTVKARQDYDDLKAKAKRLAEIEAANASDQEKAVKAARDEARAEALKEATPRIVAAEFRAAAAGRIPAEQLANILEPLDMSKFLDDKGDVDAAKVAKFIDGVSPKKAESKKFPDLGQGKRTGTAGPSVSAGRDLYQSQKKPAPTT